MGLLTILLIVAALVLGVLLWLRPALPVRWAIVLFVRLFYRMRVMGAENVPAHGPALLVCNHVSYIDWIFLLAAQRRVIRFVVFAGWTNKLFIRHLLRWGKVIPIDASSGPRAIVKSLKAAGEALSRGDVVCIFAEGRFTRTGFLLPFRRGFEEIAKRGGAPIIPVCLDELWGSVFSFYGDRCLWKLPRQLPYSVTVAFGKPMPAESNAEQVRLAVQQLAADAAIARSGDLSPVHVQFVRTATRFRFRTAIETCPSVESVEEIESLKGKNAGTSFSYAQILARAILLSSQLEKRIPRATTVGIWLPIGVDAVVANIAIALAGKASINIGNDWPQESLEPALKKWEVQSVVTGEKYQESQPFPPVAGAELLDINRLLQAASWRQRAMAQISARLLPGWLVNRFVLRSHKHSLDRPATLLPFPNASHGPTISMITHRNLASAVVSLVATYDLSRRYTISMKYPFDHCVGISLSLWAPLVAGATCQVFSPPVYTSNPHQHRKCLVRLLDLVDSQFRIDKRSLVPLSVNDRQFMQPSADVEGAITLEAYYCPELAGIAATNLPDKTLEGFTQIGNKPGTIGQPLAGMAARVVHPETFEPVVAGTEGLLQFRSASTLQGYLGDDAATKQAIRDGWFSPGDKARIDEHGFITIVDSK